MDNLIIGELPVNLYELEGLIENHQSYPQLMQKWVLFLQNLELEDKDICKLKLDPRGNGTRKLRPVFETWKARKGRDATLKALCDVFNKSFFHDISDFLEEKYWLVAVESKMIELPGDKLASLEEVTKSMLISKEKYRNIYDELKKMNGALPIQLIGKLFTFCIGSRLNEFAYIPRTLTRYTQVDKNIFSEASNNDVFVVKGIGMDELKQVLGNESAGVTENQSNRITATEQDGDYGELRFDIICRRTKNPVHLIAYQNGSFFWTKSNKGLGTIQRFILESEDEKVKNCLSEDELIKKTLRNPLSHFQNDEFCANIISDFPCMGKSRLLKHLASKLSESGKSFVVFISLPHFVSTLKTINSSSCALSALAEYLCGIQVWGNKVAELLFQEMLSSPKYKFDFILDDYEFISESDKLDRIDAFLCQFRKFKNVRAYISATPDSKHRLENIFNDIAYEIIPFNNTSNLINLLSSNLKSGSTLFSDSTQVSTLDKIRMNLEAIDVDGFCGRILCLVFKGLIADKFRKLNRSLRSKYLEVHVYESIVLLLPEWVDILKPHLTAVDEIDDHVLYSVGLIGSFKNKLYFVHNIFAECLLAEYLVTNLRSDGLSVQIVFGVILQMDEDDGNSIWPFSKLYKTKHPVVAYFVNMHLRDQIRGIRKASVWDKLFALKILQHTNQLQFKQLCEAIAMCAIQGLTYCLELGIQLLHHIPFDIDQNELNETRDRYFKYLLHVLVEQPASYDTLKIVLAFVEKRFGMDLSYYVYKSSGGNIDSYPWVPDFTPLHMAVYYGRINLAVLLIHKYGGQIINLKYLMHISTRDSSNDSDKNIMQKIKIIMMLDQEGKKYHLNWLGEKFNDCLPYETPNIHPKLQQMLLLLLRWKEGKTIYLGPLKQKLKQFFQSKGIDCDTPPRENDLDVLPTRKQSEGTEEKDMHDLLQEFCRSLGIDTPLPVSTSTVPTVVNSLLPSWTLLSGSTEPFNLQTSKNGLVVNTNVLLGEGSYGSKVYLASFAGRDKVAVKRTTVNKTEYLDDIREVNMLIKCDHDNIVHYYFSEIHSESNDQIVYDLVMEYCEITLNEFVEEKSLSFEKLNGRNERKVTVEPSRLEILRQIVTGVSYLHNKERPIIHGDIKPGNILLKRRSSELVVKLADFGTSKELADGHTHRTTDNFGGTLDWAAPELVHAMLNNTKFRHSMEGDIFSLGCIFWYVLSDGSRPFAPVPSSNYNIWIQYKPELDIRQLGNQTSHYQAIRLILFMLSLKKEARPTIKDVQNHHIFWSEQNKLAFLIEAVECKEKPDLTQVEKWIEANYAKLAGGSYSNFDLIFKKIRGQEKGWKGCLDDNIEKAMQNQNSKKPTIYDGKSLIDLLAAIRNLKAHMKEKDKAVIEVLWQSREDFINYWHAPSRFPFLLDYLWTAFVYVKWRPPTRSKKSTDKPDMFQSYLKDVTFNFSKNIKNEKEYAIDVFRDWMFGFENFEI